MLGFRSHCILLNGPPRSGKDSFVNAVRGLDGTYITVHDSFIAPVRKIFKPFTQALGAPRDTREWTEWYNEQKDVVNYNGASLRQLMISASENLIKQAFGRDIYGKVIVQNWLRMMMGISEKFDQSEGIEHLKITLVIPDLGFPDEVDPLYRVFSPEHMTIVQLRRAGCTFEGDSRMYVEKDNINVMELDNDGTLDEWEEKSRSTLKSIWKQRTSDELRAVSTRSRA